MERTPVTQEVDRLIAESIKLPDDVGTYLVSQYEQNAVYYSLIRMPILRRVDFYIQKKHRQYRREGHVRQANPWR